MKEIGLFFCLMAILVLGACNGGSSGGFFFPGNGNRPPVADAGANRTVMVGVEVTLDGSGSTDPDGDSLSFAWSFVSRPDGSSASLSNVDTENPTFTPDVAGEYIVGLVVTDGTLESDPATVIITAVLSGTWQSAAQLVADALTFDMASNSQSAMLVWIEESGGTYRLSARLYDSETDTWNGPIVIASDSTAEFVMPQVALHETGAAAVVWVQYETGGNAVWARIYQNDTWGAPQQISDGLVTSASRPHVAINETGQVLAAWQQTLATDYSIWANTFDGSWADAAQISSGSGDATQAKVALTNAGQAIAVWVQTVSSIDKLFTNQLDFNDPTPVWGAPTSIDPASIDPDFGGSSSPMLALDQAGNLTLVWNVLNDVSGLNRVRSMHFDAVLKNWIDDGEITTADDAYGQRLAVNAGGDAIAAWFQTDNEGLSIIGSSSRTGQAGAWSSAGSPNENIHSLFPAVGMDADANAVVFWHRWNGAGFEPCSAMRHGPAGEWGTPHQFLSGIVSPSEDPTWTEPKVAVFRADRAVVIWYTGLTHGIYVSAMR